MRAREILLALLLIGAGVFLTYEKSGRFDQWFDDWDVEFGLFHDFVYDENLPLSGSLPTELEVVNSHGGVEVAGTAAGRATVVFRKRISARKKADADRIAAELRATVVQDGGKLRLGTNRESFRRRRFSTDFVVAVPPGTPCTLKSSYGPVRVEGTGATDIENPHGDVVVRGITGPLTLSSSYENIAVDGIRGPTKIDSSHSDLKVKNVDGTLEIVQSNGEIDLTGIGGKTTVRAEHAGVAARDLGAGAEIETTYDAVRISEAKAVTIRARHCDVTAKNLSGPLDISDDYGLVRLAGIRGNLKIDGRNVEVEGREVASPDIFVKTGYQDVWLSGFAGKAVVVLNNGRLTLEPGSPLSGPIDVQGTYADVRMAWPAGFRAPLLIQSRDGRISWNLEDRPDSEKTNGLSETRAFTGETGKPEIKIATTHGDVRIDRAAL